MLILRPHEILKQLREEHELKQIDVARETNINISVYNKIELGSRPMRDNEIVLLSNFFNVTTDYFLGKTTKKYWELTAKEEHDVAKQMKNLIDQLKNDGELYFFGKKISDEQKSFLMHTLEIGLQLSSEKNE